MRLLFFIFISLIFILNIGNRNNLLTVAKEDGDTPSDGKPPGGEKPTGAGDSDKPAVDGGKKPAEDGGGKPTAERESKPGGDKPANRGGDEGGGEGDAKDKNKDKGDKTADAGGGAGDNAGAKDGGDSGKNQKAADGGDGGDGGGGSPSDKKKDPGKAGGEDGEQSPPGMENKPGKAGGGGGGNGGESPTDGMKNPEKAEGGDDEGSPSEKGKEPGKAVGGDGGAGSPTDDKKKPEKAERGDGEEPKKETGKTEGENGEEPSSDKKMKPEIEGGVNGGGAPAGKAPEPEKAIGGEGEGGSPVENNDPEKGGTGGREGESPPKMKKPEKAIEEKGKTMITKSKPASPARQKAILNGPSHAGPTTSGSGKKIKIREKGAATKKTFPHANTPKNGKKGKGKRTATDANSPSGGNGGSVADRKIKTIGNKQLARSQHPQQPELLPQSTVAGWQMMLQPGQVDPRMMQQQPLPPQLTGGIPQGETQIFEQGEFTVEAGHEQFSSQSGFIVGGSGGGGLAGGSYPMDPMTPDGVARVIQGFIDPKRISPHQDELITTLELSAEKEMVEQMRSVNNRPPRMKAATIIEMMYKVLTRTDEATIKADHKKEPTRHPFPNTLIHVQLNFDHLSHSPSTHDERAFIIAFKEQLSRVINTAPPAVTTHAAEHQKLAPIEKIAIALGFLTLLRRVEEHAMTKKRDKSDLLAKPLFSRTLKRRILRALKANGIKNLIEFLRELHGFQWVKKVDPRSLPTTNIPFNPAIMGPLVGNENLATSPTANSNLAEINTVNGPSGVGSVGMTQTPPPKTGRTVANNKLLNGKPAASRRSTGLGVH